MLLDRDFLNSAPGLYTENSGVAFPIKAFFFLIGGNELSCFAVLHSRMMHQKKNPHWRHPCRFNIRNEYGLYCVCISSKNLDIKHKTGEKNDTKQ